MNPDCYKYGQSDKKLNAFITEDKYIQMKRIKCGHLTNAFDWIIKEFAEEKKALVIENQVEIECNGVIRKLKQSLHFLSYNNSL